MVIGVISDTHLHGPGDPLPAAVCKLFEGVDLILHAGDLTDISVLAKLEAIAPLEAVTGNMDSGEAKKCLPVKKILSVKGLSVGLIHGWGSPWGIRGRIRGEFKGVQAVVYGHTHQPFADFEDGIYFFNPGSAKRHPLGGRATCGRLIIGEGIRGEILDL